MMVGDDKRCICDIMSSIKSSSFWERWRRRSIINDPILRAEREMTLVKSESESRMSGEDVKYGWHTQLLLVVRMTRLLNFHFRE
jgi:hypothetical protein